MALVRPAEVNLAQLDPSVALALAFLQAVSSGLPGEVVASAAGATTQQLQDMLPNSDWVSIDENAWRIRPLPFQVPVQSRTDLLCRGFEGLLSFLSSHETDKRSEEQLRNAISLSRACLRVRPELALPLFQASEHIVKNMGDRHLLLEISDLCIDAGRQSCGGDNERRACACARAQAMLCGTSWVLQRTNRLAEASSWAEKSLRLGQDIGWDRNTAFAKKCMGRLDRIQAEQPVTRAEDKASLLRESATKLQEAIQMFSNLREFGPTNRQVGDCYSLLARTYLTAGKRGDMEAALRKAYEILTPGSTKMYFDLLILDGDYEVAWGKRELAEERYKEVISHHSQESREHSEIYARALSRRAANRSKLGRKQPAILDYELAARAWRSLGEFEGGMGAN
jgi:tetratricopeptide (TPR) repeat protein